MIEVLVSVDCKDLMNSLGIAPDLVAMTMNDRHRGLVSDGLDRIAAARWFDDDRIIMIDSLVTKSERQPKLGRVRFDQVTVQLALELRSELPSGTIDRGMSMEQILAVVAESFGYPVSFHPDEPAASLYSGRWDGQRAINVANDRQPSRLFATASFTPATKTCELAYSIDIDRYLWWFLRPTIAATGLTFEHLTALATAFPWNFPTIRPTSEAVQYALAAAVLRVFLGDRWCDKHLPGAVGAHPRFQQTGADSLTRMKAQSWTVALAELIFNLQHVPGFHGRVKRLKRDDLESAVGEFEAAQLLALSDIPFAFVDESGKRGHDYEGEAELPSGGIACWEVKRKQDDTALREQTISNSIDEAAKQLPSDSPGIIFLKIPEQWVTEPAIKNIMESTVLRAFQTRQRIVAIAIFWEEWKQLKSGSLLRLLKFREIPNLESRHYDPQNAGLFKDYDQIHRTTRWRRFSDVVREIRTAPTGQRSPTPPV